MLNCFLIAEEARGVGLNFSIRRCVIYGSSVDRLSVF